MIEQIRAMLAMHEAGAAMCRSLLEQIEYQPECPHDNVSIAAGSTMGEGNQKYVCLDCEMEVTEDDWIRSQERQDMV